MKVLLLSIFLILGANVYSQDYNRLAPKSLPSKKATSTISEPSLPEKRKVENETSPIKIRGIVFLPSQDRIKEEGLVSIRGVNVREIPLLQSEEFIHQMDKYAQAEVTLETINQLVRDVVLYYRKKHRPIVDVFVPDQDITCGVMQVVVLEGKLGEVSVSKTRWFNPILFSDQISLRSGDVIDTEQLQTDLNWLNRNPFRQVEAAFSKGKEVGVTDIELHVQERFPLRFYGGYENTGTRLSGSDRWLAGFNWGNALWLDHQFSYQFTTSSDFEKMQAHSGNYVIPLPWRHTITIFGSYAELKPNLPAPFDLMGRNWQIGERYEIPLPKIREYQHSLTAGFDFKQSNNNLDFGGANVFNTTVDIYQWSLDYSANIKDPWGSTAAGVTGFYSPGGLDQHNKDENFTKARAFAKAEYSYAKFRIERVTQLPFDFTWMVKGTYQIADTNLLGSEQLGIGGFNTVRGYEEREVNGDLGYLVTNELRTPPISLNLFAGLTQAPDQLQFLAFWDYGTVKNNTLLSGEPAHKQLSSIGSGIRYTINPYISFYCDYGWQLMDSGLNEPYNSRGHMGLLISY